VKAILTYFILASVLMASLTKALVVTSFLVNQDIIASKFCENKNLPEKKCNGHCYLNKNLKNDDSKSDKNSVPRSSQIFEEFVWSTGSEKSSFNYLFFFSSKLIQLSYDNESYAYSHISSIAHPPSA
jgi:hypothetical protein